MQLGGPVDKAHPSIGINAKRGCTDICCLLILFIMIGGLVFVAQLGLTHGNPDRLIYGTDYLGNLCGRDDPAVLVTDWSVRKLLWYPITYDHVKKEIIVIDALKLGLCVEKCPVSADLYVQGYGSVNSTVSPPVWPILFSSKAKFHRCIPDFLTFDCKNSSDCLTNLATAGGRFNNGMEVINMATQGMEELKEGWWIILASVGIVIVVSFVWLFCLRRLVKPVVVLTAILVLLLLLGGAYLCYIKRQSLLDETPPQEQSAKYWLGGSIACLVFAFLYICVMIFLFKDVMTACDIIEEASKVPVAIPTMVLVPPLLLLFVVPLAMFCIFVAIYVQSSGSVLTLSLPAPKFNLTDIVSNSSVFSNASSVEDVMEIKDYSFENWRTWAHIYNLFMFLWGFGLINAICFLTLALCGVFWYWSVPGDAKEPPVGSVGIALLITFRYHIGTVALGSFIVAVVQLARILLAVLEYKMKEAGERSDTVKCIFKVLHCCLACLERVVKFINKNAYIMCAMEGTNFLTSARNALELLMANALSVGAVTVIGEYVMIFGKVMITAATTWIAYFLVKSQEKDDGVTSGVLIVAVVAIVAFFIASLFMNILSVCIDTVLLCFCYDKAHDGEDYYPEDLAKHVSAMALAKGVEMEKAKRAQGSVQQQEMSKRLLVKHSNSDDDL